MPFFISRKQDVLPLKNPEQNIVINLWYWKQILIIYYAIKMRYLKVLARILFSWWRIFPSFLFITYWDLCNFMILLTRRVKPSVWTSFRLNWIWLKNVSFFFKGRVYILINNNFLNKFLRAKIMFIMKIPFQRYASVLPSFRLKSQSLTAPWIQCT